MALVSRRVCLRSNTLVRVRGMWVLCLSRDTASEGSTAKPSRLNHSGSHRPDIPVPRSTGDDRLRVCHVALDRRRVDAEQSYRFALLAPSHVASSDVLGANLLLRLPFAHEHRWTRREK